MPAGVLPTEDLRVTSTAPTPGETVSYAVTVLGVIPGGGRVTTEMVSADVPGTAVTSTVDVRFRLGAYNGSQTKVAGVIIRAAGDHDWPRIWPFFASIVAAGETYAYPDGLTLQTGRPLWMEVSPGQTVVAIDGDVVLGSAKMGPNRPGRGAHVATASFLVDPAYQGKGVGRALGRYAIEWARAAGYRGMQFNAVVATNTAAVRLWQSLGFVILATVPEAFDHPRHGLVGLHVMFQRL